MTAQIKINKGNLIVLRSLPEIKQFMWAQGCHERYEKGAIMWHKDGEDYNVYDGSYSVAQGKLCKAPKVKKKSKRRKMR